MNKYLLKMAFDEKSRHLEALSQLEKKKGLLLHWSVGSGKTSAYLVAIKKELDENKKKRALVVAPASLVSNIDKEIKKHGIQLDRKRLDVYSYEKAVNIADQLAKNDYAITVADEAQKLRNADTKRTKVLADVLAAGDKRLLGTATANYNHAADVAPLINIAAGRRLLPEDKKEFENRYLQKVHKSQTFMQKVLKKPKEEEVVLKNGAHLKAVFGNYVHHYDSAEDPAAADKFPTKEVRKIDVEMSPEQKKMYGFVEGKIPFMLRMKIRHNLPMDKKEKAQLNSFAVGVRQASNGTRHMVQDKDSAEYTPKIQRAVGNLEKMMKEDKNFRGLVYSNFLDAGVNEYSSLLKRKGIDHHVYTGGITAAEKDGMVKDFNSGKKKVLVISSSGAEGLDLKGVKLTQILDPHFNKSKIQQVEGRGVRYESHEHLPKEERKVVIEHYRSVHPTPAFGKAPTSIDQYLSDMSDDKKQVFDQMKSLMKARND